MKIDTKIKKQREMVDFLDRSINCVEMLISQSASLDPIEPYTLGLVFDTLFRTKSELSMILRDQEGWLELLIGGENA